MLMVGLPAPALLLIPGGFFRGFVAGALVATAAGLLAFWVVQVTGTAPTMMGDQGEQWTAGELRKLRRHGWRVVNHFQLRPWDMDHVLIGPGGVYVIETKWSAKEWEFAPLEPRITEALRRARDNARDLQMWEPFKRACSVPVAPILVLWGTGLGLRTDLPAMTHHEGAVLVVGPRFDEWRRSLASDHLTADHVDQLWRVLELQARRRDELAEEEGTVVPASMMAIATHAAMVLAAALLGLVAALQLASHVHDKHLWPFLVVALVAVGAVVRRVPRLHYVGLGWITGVTSSVVLLAAIFLFAVT
jgi:hypothetical protein